MKKLLALLVSAFALVLPAQAFATTCSQSHSSGTGNYTAAWETNNVAGGDIFANIQNTQAMSTVYQGNISYWIMAVPSSGSGFLQAGVITDHGGSSPHAFYEYNSGSSDTYYNIKYITNNSTHGYELRKWGPGQWLVIVDGVQFGPFAINPVTFYYAVESQERAASTWSGPCNVAGANFTSINPNGPWLYKTTDGPYFLSQPGANWLTANGS